MKFQLSYFRMLILLWYPHSMVHYVAYITVYYAHIRISLV